jgi:predicted AlkP superfamily pyrophosphatase or phosphodiesterase
MRLILFIGLMLILVTCRDKTTVVTDVPVYKTKHVVVIVIDGPRYSETWGYKSREHIPVRNGLLSQGVLVEPFSNNGATVTNPGHTAIATGNYDAVANNGSELPHNPSMFQSMLLFTKKPAYKAYIVASKDKLYILGNTQSAGYHNMYRPYIDCGVNQNGTGGYRADSITYQHVIAVLQNRKPDLMLINFKDPDVYGHMADSVKYIAAIEKSDEYVGLIWDYLQSDPYYKDQTTLIVTNDHGRHLNGISNGYVSHGDGCAGCRKIEFFAISPDFKKNVVVQTPYEQIDIPSTISELLHFPLPYGKGRVMRDVFLP